MPIRINLDLMLVRCKIKSYELAAKIGITPQNLSIFKDRQSQGHPDGDIDRQLPAPSMPTG